MVNLYITCVIQENLFYTVPPGAIKTYKISIESQFAQCEVNAFFGSVCLVRLIRSTVFLCFMFCTFFCPMKEIIIIDGLSAYLEVKHMMLLGVEHANFGKCIMWL